MTDNAPSAEAIERDIEQTQNSISETVEELQRRLNPRSLLDAVIGDEQQSSQRLIEAAKTNPLAVGLLGVGALLLATGKTPSLSGLRGSGAGGSLSGDGAESNSGGASRKIGGRSWLRSQDSDHHASYLDHMAKHAQREGEDDASYQRRRDYARADYFMIDRHHDEDEGGFRARLNDAQEKLRSKTSAFGDSVRRASHDGLDSLSSARQSVADKSKAALGSAREWSGGATQKASDTYMQNPALGGLIAAALGAAIGAAVPTTQIERRKLGSLGGQAWDTIDEQKHKALDMVEEQKTKVVDKANRLLDDAGSNAASGENPMGAGSDPVSQPQPTSTQA